MSRKSAAVGTGAIALRPLVDIVNMQNRLEVKGLEAGDSSGVHQPFIKFLVISHDSDLRSTCPVYTGRGPCECFSNYSSPIEGL